MAHQATMRAGIRATIGLAVVAAWAALAGGVVAADGAVTIKDFAFGPATVTVNTGDTVTWTNADSAAHTATATGGAFDTGTIASGATASVTFTKAGTYAYKCAIHPRMTGTIVVKGAAAPQTDAAPANDGATTTGGGPTTTVLGLLAVAGLLGTLLARRRLATARH